MRFFCEEISRRILPKVRAEMARELVLRYGLSQSETARKLGITQAAVSQYIKRVRADSTLSDEMISEGCKKIVSSNLDTEKVMEIIWKICLHLVKKEKNVYVPKGI